MGSGHTFPTCLWPQKWIYFRMLRVVSSPNALHPVLHLPPYGELLQTPCSMILGILDSEDLHDPALPTIHLVANCRWISWVVSSSMSSSNLNLMDFLCVCVWLKRCCQVFFFSVRRVGVVVLIVFFLCWSSVIMSTFWVYLIILYFWAVLVIDEK